MPAGPQRWTHGSFGARAIMEKVWIHFSDLLPWMRMKALVSNRESVINSTRGFVRFRHRARAYRISLVCRSHRPTSSVPRRNRWSKDCCLAMSSEKYLPRSRIPAPANHPGSCPPICLPREIKAEELSHRTSHYVTSGHQFVDEPRFVLPECIDGFHVLSIFLYNSLSVRTQPTMSSILLSSHYL